MSVNVSRAGTETDREHAAALPETNVVLEAQIASLSLEMERLRAGEQRPPLARFRDEEFGFSVEMISAPRS